MENKNNIVTPKMFSSFLKTKVEDLGDLYLSPTTVNCLFKGCNLLMYLLETQDVDKTELDEKIYFLVHAGIDVNHKDNQRCNILFYLIKYYNGECLQDIIILFLEKGIDINCKNRSKRNLLHKLVSSGMDRPLKVKIMRLLIRFGLEVSDEIKKHPKYYEKYFNKTPISGESFINLMAKYNKTIGWHEECRICEDILSIKTYKVKALFHKYAFNNICETSAIIVADIVKWSKIIEDELRQDDETNWFARKAEEFSSADHQYHDLCRGFRYLSELHSLRYLNCAETVFNCDQYELYLRSFRDIAVKLEATDTVEHMDWYYFISFDFPRLSRIDKHKMFIKSKAQTAKREMEKVLFNWVHNKSDGFYGISFPKELADMYTEECGSIVFKYKCHGQE